ncbi:hypothetical protein RJP21_00665 [Paenibacillus sp. VCA1]|uniref:hypothetical protein n=1 Tax=Paenibacillus sp. VCA1 TaxID=3039148 RepID=UPI002871F8D4|nr:hypothetical protein [Paenibacillus sp. VCA1]MDR9852106.1 hypothetical protein [Paenibacillus sp. VCA1]
MNYSLLKSKDKADASDASFLSEKLLGDRFRFFTTIPSPPLLSLFAGTILPIEIQIGRWSSIGELLFSLVRSVPSAGFSA